jgi:hypothetical protein
MSERVHGYYQRHLIVRESRMDDDRRRQDDREELDHVSGVLDIAPNVKGA